MTFPEELKYSKDDEWVKMLDDDTALIGITDYAQQEMGDLVFINLPAEGGEGVAVLEDPLTDVGAELLGDYLPEGVDISLSGTKWVLPKAGKVTFVKGTDEVDEDKTGENPSGLKLSYKAKDGSFSGSFKVYAIVNGKIKSYTANVAGVLVDGIGYGTATLKKPVCSWGVRVE